MIQCKLNYLPRPDVPVIDLNQMAKWLKVLAEPNRLLIFHLLDVKRDAVDGRWMYYFINQQALEKLNQAWDAFSAAVDYRGMRAHRAAA